MNSIYIYVQKDEIGALRGSGRIVQILKENLSPFRHPEQSNLNEIKFISDIAEVKPENALFIPSWQPFQPSRLSKRVAKVQILIIFDVIPLKYPHHFPIGLRGWINLWRNK